MKMQPSGLFSRYQMKGKVLLRSVRPIREKFRNGKTSVFLGIVDGMSRLGRGGPGVNGEFLPVYEKFSEVAVVNFVVCPNKYFPIEPHMHLRSYLFLPKSVQRKVAPHTPGCLHEHEEINLLTADVRSLGFPLIGNSIVAIHRRENAIA